jgi:hypothetical protein
MRTLPALLCLPLLAAAGSLHASDNLADPFVRVGVAAWYATPSITIEPDGGGEVKGSDVGLDESRIGGMIDAYVDTPIPLLPGIHAGLWQWKGTPDEGDDLIVTGGYAVAMWEIELLDRVGVAFGAGAIGQRLDGGDDADAKDTLMPAAAGRAWVRITDGLTAEVHLIAGAWDKDRGGDAVAQATWRLIGPLAVIGGWRQTWSTQEDFADATWKIRLGGPFLGAAAVF